MSILTRLKSALAWQTAKGRDLIRLDENATQATVAISGADETGGARLTCFPLMTTYQEPVDFRSQGFAMRMKNPSR